MDSSPLWKRIAILLFCGWGILAAVPNLFYAQVERHNDAISAIDLAAGTATPEMEAARAEWPEILPEGQEILDFLFETQRILPEGQDLQQEG